MAATIGPLAGMTLASAGCAALLTLLVGDLRGILFGTAGPLAAALGTWAAVARVHRRDPARVPGLMIVLFGLKMVAYPAYVVAVVLLLDVRSTAFVVSFACQIVLLYGLEAWYLRRLFAGAR
jgi:hypothetical protein